MIMDEKYIKLKIAKLRTDRNISARELSLALGQSTGYITCTQMSPASKAAGSISGFQWEIKTPTETLSS